MVNLIRFLFRVNPATGLLEMSKTKCKVKDLKSLGKLIITVLNKLGLLSVQYSNDGDDDYIEFNNMTIINLTIKFVGPIYEGRLTSILLLIQVLSMFTAMSQR